MKLLKFSSNILFLFALVLATNTINAQVSYKDKDMTWYGLDFTKAKLIGEAGFTDPDEIKERFFNKWNVLLKAEKEKYDFEKYFGKENVDYSLDLVKDRNETVEVKGLVTEETYLIDEEAVKEVASAYKSEEKGLGLVFVIESFNKLEAKSFIWVTFFDKSNGEVIKTQRVDSKAGGFGLRNYWAGSIYKLMKSAKKTLDL